jgi:hypothetical protein
MQKVINALAIASFIVSGAVVGGGAYLYLSKDAILDGIKEGVTKHATEAITNALPGMLDSAVPELPSTTGGAIPGVPSGF